MLGRSRLAMLASLIVAGGPVLVAGGQPRFYGAPEPAIDFSPSPFSAGRGGYPRKDRHKNAAQVKRASIKAANRARNRGAHRG